MKKKKLIVSLLFMLFAPGYIFAQFTINQQTENNAVGIKPVEDKRLTNPAIVPIKYTTDAMIEAERRRIRKKRNTLEILADATASQIYFSNWATGGNRTFSTRQSLSVLYKYENERLSFTNKFNSRLGFNIVDTTTFKNEDLFELSSLGEWRIDKHWSYSGLMIFRSQFMKGYKSINNNTLVSDFLSPGTYELGFGFTYKPFKQPLFITISPISGKMLFVRNEELSQRKLNGIEKGKHVKAWLGPSLMVTYSQRFYKDKLEVKSNFNTFYNIGISPVMRFENTISYRPVKFLIAKFYLLAIKDSEVMPPEIKNRIQLNYAVTLGFSYAFKNK